MTKAESLELLEKVLKLAKADAVTASINGGLQGSTRLADNIITQNVMGRDATLRVTCAYGQSHATATTNDFSPDALKAVVERAQASAKVSPPDPEYMPPVEATEQKKYKKVKAHVPATAKLAPLTKAKQLEAAVAVVQGKGLRVSGAYANSASFQAFANSAGLRAFHQSTEAEIHATVLAGLGSGWADAVSNDAREIDPKEVAGRALKYATAAQDPQDLPAGKYTVIMHPPAVTELLAHLIWGGFDAKATDEGRTCLRGKLGTRICGEKITMYSDPADPRCPGTPFLGDGLAAPSLPWIEKGVVKNLFYSRYWAKKQGKRATGWLTNLIMPGQNISEAKMIASTERGLLITRFWYIRFVDPMVPSVTGMTRDGLFLIENGKISRPVKHMRFNENVIDVLNRVEMLGKPQRAGEFSVALIPTLKVRDFNFTSTTKF